MIYFGIDLGLKGAIAMISGSGKLIQTEIMPTIRGKEYDIIQICADINSMKKLASQDAPAYAVIETPSESPKWAKKTIRSMARALGIFEAIFALYGLRYDCQRAKAWQKVIHAGISGTDPKAKSAIFVNRQFPSINTTHDGIIDALCIAEYCRRIYNQNNT